MFSGMTHLLAFLNVRLGMIDFSKYVRDGDATVTMVDEIKTMVPQRRSTTSVRKTSLLYSIMAVLWTIGTIAFGLYNKKFLATAFPQDKSDDMVPTIPSARMPKETRVGNIHVADRSFITDKSGRTTRWNLTSAIADISTEYLGSKLELPLK